jgi:hypothetical protein
VCIMIIQAEIAEVSVSRPIIGRLCHTSREQSVPTTTVVPPPYPRRNFTTILICGIGAFMLSPYPKEDPLIQGGILQLSQSIG